MKTSRFFSTLHGLILFLALASVHGKAANLTAAMMFSCDPHGDPAGNFVWDTRGLSSDFYKVWLTRGLPNGEPDGLLGGFINGPTWALAPINLPIEEGTNHFTMFFQHNGPWHTFAVNLFFQSNVVAMISAKTPLRTNDSVPVFSANHSRLTYSLTSYPFPNVPAAGTTSVVLDRVVELTDFQVFATNLVSIDRISTHSVTTNGRHDYVGTLTLVAGSRRPPSSRPVKVEIHTTEVTICWASEAGRYYQLQHRSSGQDNSWTHLGSPVLGNGTTNCIADRVEVGQHPRFYRVLELE